MKFNKRNADLFVPDGSDEAAAMCRTNYLCIAAHQDDAEIMAYTAILNCYGRNDKWFTGIVLTDGGGSPRNGKYKDMTDNQMVNIRACEQKEAALLGQYSCQFLLAYTSSEVRADNPGLIAELAGIIEKCSPESVFIHNLADKHDTHVAAALKAIAALRRLPPEKRPVRVYCMEAWRSLDWLMDDDKVVFDTSGNDLLADSLIKSFDSQVNGGKRYDLASIGRRTANATFLQDHMVDGVESAQYGLDITELIMKPDLNPAEFINSYIEKFKNDVIYKVNKYGF